MDHNAMYDASLDAEMEERSKVEFIRDDSDTIIIGDNPQGKIASYKFKILIRDKAALEGELTREEMDLIYRLYSAEGSNLQQRHVSRYFPNYTFQDFKRILRAFNITKASSPFAPHIIEEKTTDELIQLNLQSRENDYLKKFEQERNRLTEVAYKDLLKKHHELKNKVSDLSDFLSETKFNITPLDLRNKRKVFRESNTIVLYLSDIHMGADVSAYSIYNNTYNIDVAKERMASVLNTVFEAADMFKCGNIVVCNIGDSIDGYNQETTRGGHKLPQNMDNKDQYKNYVELMLSVFADLSSSGKFDTIKYYSVDGGNHDGDVGYIINKSLEACLNILNPEIEVEIFDKFIDHFKVNDHTFVLCHGKDAKDMFKNLPLTINDKTENQINEFLDYNRIYGSNIHFIKGDLHQTATTYAKRFRYKSVSSFFGSSEWIHKNFGNTKAAVDYEVISGDNIFESRIVLN